MWRYPGHPLGGAKKRGAARRATPINHSKDANSVQWVAAAPPPAEAATAALMNANPFGVPKPVTLSHPGPVVRDESVPNTNTSQRVEVEL